MLLCLNIYFADSKISSEIHCWGQKLLRSFRRWKLQYESFGEEEFTKKKKKNRRQTEETKKIEENPELFILEPT